MGLHKTYLTRWLIPVSSPAIRHAVIRVLDGKVTEFGAAAAADLHDRNIVDLGDVAVIPKLVNAHTHLEFSDFDAPIGSPGIPLADWIGEVIRARGVSDGFESDEAMRNDAIAQGLDESIRAGVGLIGDIATTPSRYPAKMNSRIVSFAEVLGLTQSRGEETFGAAETHRGKYSDSEFVEPAISPHAPYSTPLSVVERCITWAESNGLPVAMHLAESPDERELLSSGRGRFYESLLRAGFWQAGLFPHSDTEPVQAILRILSTAPSALVVHGNDLRLDEIRMIATQPQMSVVYCPRTHRFFGYGKHPVDQMLKHGVRVALGTDSRASNPDLSVWEEVRFLLCHRQDLAPFQILRMATIMGAEALGLASRTLRNLWLGQIHPGKTRFDSLLMVPTNATDLSHMYDDFASTATDKIRFCGAPNLSVGHNGDADSQASQSFTN